MLAATRAELAELKTAGGRLLVLGRRVVPLFAFRALQGYNLTHFKNPSRQILFHVRDSKPLL
jgi:hypothetical protein